MFGGLSDNLAKVFDKLRRKAILTEEDINLAAREIRIALLEADVALPVIKDLIEKLKSKAIGESAIKSVSAVQQIIKIVNDLLIEILSAENQELNLNVAPPAVILMVGLQGAGKTTTAAKLALMLKKQHNKKILLVSTDIYRPAAQKQLATLAQQNNIVSLPIIEGQQPLQITERAMQVARAESFDVVIIDTAGRLHTDQELMEEIRQIESFVKPIETILVLDSMIGQDSINVANNFLEYVKITGLIMTRIDGDARGGAALSIKSITGLPIKFVGIGEKASDLEAFHPERIASRILGMGDVVSLVEKAASVLDEKQAEKMANKMMKGHFDMNDLADQIRNIKKMGGMFSIVNLMPGMGQIKQKMNEANVDEKVFEYQLAIISSMTKRERRNPMIVNGSRRKRIANGSGRKIEEVNKLLKMHKDMSDMMKKFSKMDKKSFMRSGLSKLFS